MRPTAPFRVLVRGIFPAHNLEVRWREGEPDFPTEHRQAVLSYWDRLLASRPQANLYDGPLCRLEEFRVVDDVLVLTLGRTRYRDLLYSNAHAQVLAAADRADLLSRALGVSAVVKTADKQIVLLQRSQHVGEAPGMLDVVGGHIQPEAESPGTAPDPLAAIVAEVVEELNVPPGSLGPWLCLGLIETTETRKPEMIFSVGLADSFSVVAECSRWACDHFEFDGLLAVQEGELGGFLQSHADRMSPSALGALHLYDEEIK